MVRLTDVRQKRQGFSTVFSKNSTQLVDRVRLNPPTAGCHSGRLGQPNDACTKLLQRVISRRQPPFPAAGLLTQLSRWRRSVSLPTTAAPATTLPLALTLPLLLPLLTNLLLLL